MVMKVIQKLKRWNPIEGDDLPYYTIALRDCPKGFHFSNIVKDDSLTHLNAMWDALIDYAERYYSEYEVVGSTLQDFLHGLQLSFDGNKLMFENMLSNLPYIRFGVGQTVKRTRQGSDTESGSATKGRTYSESNGVVTSGKDKRIVLGFDSQNEKPSDKTESENTQNTNGSGTENQSDSTKHDRSSEETETVVTDRFAGENPIDFYERVLKVYPNIYDTFVKMFESNFTLREVLIW